MAVEAQDKAIAFERRLKSLYKNRGLLISYQPKYNGSPINLYKLYALVQANGGSSKITDSNRWYDIAVSYGLPKSCINVAYLMKQIYTRYLEPYERIEKGELSHQSSLFDESSLSNAQLSTYDSNPYENFSSSHRNSSASLTTQHTQSRQLFGKITYPIKSTTNTIVQNNSTYPLSSPLHACHRVKMALCLELPNEIHGALGWLYALALNECAINEARNHFVASGGMLETLPNPHLLTYLNGAESKTYQRFLLNLYKAFTASKINNQVHGFKSAPNSVLKASFQPENLSASHYAFLQCCSFNDSSDALTKNIPSSNDSMQRKNLLSFKHGGIVQLMLNLVYFDNPKDDEDTRVAALNNRTDLKIFKFWRKNLRPGLFKDTLESYLTATSFAPSAITEKEIEGDSKEELEWKIKLELIVNSFRCWSFVPGNAVALAGNNTFLEFVYNVINLSEELEHIRNHGLDLLANVSKYLYFPLMDNALSDLFFDQINRDSQSTDRFVLMRTFEIISNTMVAPFNLSEIYQSPPSSHENSGLNHFITDLHCNSHLISGRISSMCRGKNSILARLVDMTTLVSDMITLYRTLETIYTLTYYSAISDSGRIGVFQTRPRRKKIIASAQTSAICDCFATLKSFIKILINLITYRVSTSSCSRDSLSKPKQSFNILQDQEDPIILVDKRSTYIALQKIKEREAANVMRQYQKMGKPFIDPPVVDQISSNAIPTQTQPVMPSAYQHKSSKTLSDMGSNVPYRDAFPDNHHVNHALFPAVHVNHENTKSIDMSCPSPSLNRQHAVNHASPLSTKNTATPVKIFTHSPLQNPVHFQAARFAERWFRAFYELHSGTITPRAEMLNCYYTYGKRYFKETFKPLKYTSLCNCIKRAFPKAKIDRRTRENGQLQVLLEGIRKRPIPLPLEQVPQLTPKEYLPAGYKISEFVPPSFAPQTPIFTSPTTLSTGRRSSKRRRTSTSNSNLRFSQSAKDLNSSVKSVEALDYNISSNLKAEQMFPLEGRLSTSINNDLTSSPKTVIKAEAVYTDDNKYFMSDEIKYILPHTPKIKNNAHDNTTVPKPDPLSIILSNPSSTTSSARSSWTSPTNREILLKAGFRHNSKSYLQRKQYTTSNCVTHKNNNGNVNNGTMNVKSEFFPDEMGTQQDQAAEITCNKGNFSARKQLNRLAVSRKSNFKKPGYYGYTMKKRQGRPKGSFGLRKRQLIESLHSNPSIDITDIDFSSIRAKYPRRKRSKQHLTTRKLYPLRDLINNLTSSNNKHLENSNTHVLSKASVCPELIPQITQISKDIFSSCTITPNTLQLQNSIISKSHAGPIVNDNSNASANSSSFGDSLKSLLSGFESSKSILAQILPISASSLPDAPNNQVQINSPLPIDNQQQLILHSNAEPLGAGFTIVDNSNKSREESPLLCARLLKNSTNSGPAVSTSISPPSTSNVIPYSLTLDVLNGANHVHNSLPTTETNPRTNIDADHFAGSDQVIWQQMPPDPNKEAENKISQVGQEDDKLCILTQHPIQLDLPNVINTNRHNELDPASKLSISTAITDNPTQLSLNERSLFDINDGHQSNSFFSTLRPPISVVDNHLSNYNNSLPATTSSLPALPVVLSSQFQETASYKETSPGDITSTVETPFINHSNYLTNNINVSHNVSSNDNCPKITHSDNSVTAAFENYEAEPMELDIDEAVAPIELSSGAVSSSIRPPLFTDNHQTTHVLSNGTLGDIHEAYSAINIKNIEKGGNNLAINVNNVENDLGELDLEHNNEIFSHKTQPPNESFNPNESQKEEENPQNSSQRQDHLIHRPPSISTDAQTFLTTPLAISINLPTSSRPTITDVTHLIRPSFDVKSEFLLDTVAHSFCHDEIMSDRAISTLNGLKPEICKGLSNHFLTNKDLKKSFNSIHTEIEPLGEINNNEKLDEFNMEVSQASNLFLTPNEASQFVKNNKINFSFRENLSPLNFFPKEAALEYISSLSDNHIPNTLSQITSINNDVNPDKIQIGNSNNATKCVNNHQSVNDHYVVNELDSNAEQITPAEPILNIAHSGIHVNRPSPALNMEYVDGFICGWHGCSFTSTFVKSLLSHAYFGHTTHDGYCQWSPCHKIDMSKRVYRSKYSLVTHIQDFHCSHTNIHTLSAKVPVNIPILKNIVDSSPVLNQIPCATESLPSIIASTSTPNAIDGQPIQIKSLNGVRDSAILNDDHHIASLHQNKDELGPKEPKVILRYRKDDDTYHGNDMISSPIHLPPQSHVETDLAKTTVLKNKPDHTALQTIYRFFNMSVASTSNLQPSHSEMTSENSINTSINLLSALILRNIAKHSYIGKSKIKIYEPQLTTILTNCNHEVSWALSQLLWEISQ